MHPSVHRDFAKLPSDFKELWPTYISSFVEMCTEAHNDGIHPCVLAAAMVHAGSGVLHDICGRTSAESMLVSLLEVIETLQGQTMFNETLAPKSADS